MPDNWLSEKSHWKSQLEYTLFFYKQRFFSTQPQGGKKPGSGGAALPRNQDKTFEVRHWRQKDLLEKKHLFWY